MSPEPDSSAAGAPPERLPNLIIVGVAKAGTTSLFSYLGQHPDVCPADVKELHYFTALPLTGHLPPLDAYASHFRHCDRSRYRLEASPDYWWSAKEVAPLIAETLPDVRIMISLRDPVRRLWSAYTYLRSMGRLARAETFEQFVDDCRRQTTRRHGVAHGTTPLDVGYYADHLATWLEIFGSRARVVFAEHLFTAPQATMASLFSWLDIDETVADRLDVRARNVTVAPRNESVARLAWRARRRLVRSGIRQRRLRLALRRLYGALNGRSPDEAMSSAVRRQLDDLYHSSNQRTADLLAGLDVGPLPDWLESARSEPQVIDLRDRAPETETAAEHATDRDRVR